MKYKSELGLFVLFASALVASDSAYAAQASTNMNVSADVANSCTVSVGNMAFGTIPVTAGHPSTTITHDVTLTITCSVDPVDAKIVFNDGLNAGATARQMKKGTSTDLIPYDIYYGSAAPANEITLGDTGKNLVRANFTNGVWSSTVVGEVHDTTPIPGSGTYLDTVLITVDYNP